MKLINTFEFKQDINVVFEHMIHYKDFAKWNPIKGIHNVTDLRNDGIYSGFSMSFDLGDKIAVTDCESLFYVKDEEVRYRVARCVFEDGTDVQNGWSFPYSEMYQRLIFAGGRGNCTVIHEVVLTPKNWLGWLTCKFGVLPRINSELIKSNRALNEYLAEI